MIDRPTPVAGATAGLSALLRFFVEINTIIYNFLVLLFD